jgi:hypothetical protein
MEPANTSKCIQTLDDFIDHLTPSVTITGSTPVEVFLDKVRLEFHGEGSLVFTMRGQWTQASARLRQAVARYKHIISWVDAAYRTPGTVKFVAGAPIPIRMKMDGLLLIPEIVTTSNRGVDITLSGEYDGTKPVPLSPVDLLAAVRAGDLDGLRDIVGSGVDINTQVGSTHVAIEVLQRVNDKISDWLLRQPELDWNAQLSRPDTAPLIHWILSSESISYHLLPWARINLHAEDSLGNNALHCAGLLVSEGIIGPMLQHGSGTLALSFNSDMKRPLEGWRGIVTDTMRYIERDTMVIIAEWLLHCITVPDLVTVITGYYTTFCLPLKRKS